MKFSLENNQKAWIFAMLVAALVSFTFINAYPISILDEAKNAEAAREMWATGNYWVPTFNGELRTDKPPLHYYFMLLGFKLFGTTVLGARFFSAVMGFITLLATFGFARKHLGNTEAQTTMLILVGSFFFMQEFHLAVPDPYLIAFVNLGLFSFYHFYATKKHLYLVLFYFFLALGTLSKGPVAVALPGLSVGVFLILQKELKNTFRYYPVLGLLGIAILVVPWFWQVHLKTDGLWTEGFFFDHNISRFSAPMEGHGGSFLVSWGFVLLGLLPFSFFIPQAFGHVLRKRSNTALVFAACVAGVFILFFSISSTKLPNYTMPGYAFLVLLLGAFFTKKMEIGFSCWNIISVLLLLLLGLALPVVGYIGMQQEASLVSISYLAIGLVPTAIGTLLGFLFYIRKRAAAFLVSNAFSWGMLLFVLHGYLYPKLTAVLPTTAVAEVLPENANIVVYKRMDAAFPFAFQQTFKVIDNLNNTSSLQGYYILTNHPEGQNLDAFDNISQVIRRKALFENHTTVLYQIK
tara:strand:+ start:5730 stop:7289 length:1560 start_codon:yes stop_codon:yes gene_type:complete